ncbi:hypothetical protein JCM16161A_15860 [Vulcanisaeta sp. JCM 16161]|uniref:hypothetical protein n=1 Tax=Vulcanisaeta sp. JCM 16161 TaxID=1295372 RepID=UPI00406CD8AE
MGTPLKVYAVIIGLITLGLTALVNAQVLVLPPQGPWLSESMAIQAPSYLVVLPAGCNPQQPYNLYVFTPSQYSAWASGGPRGYLRGGAN